MAWRYNLTAFARELRQRGVHVDLAGAIMNQMYMSSRVADLAHAADLLKLLTKMEAAKSQVQRGGPAWSEFADMQGALLAQAIILYVRAATPGDNGRGLPFKIRHGLSVDEMRIHEALCQTRKKAIAHLDGEDEQDWHADSLVMVMREDGTGEYRSTYSRTTYRPEALQDLQVVVHSVRKYVDRISKEAMEALNAKLQDAFRREPTLEALLQTFPFDSRAFFGPSPEAEAATQAILQGGEGDYHWHVNPALGSS